MNEISTEGYSGLIHKEHSVVLYRDGVKIGVYQPNFLQGVGVYHNLLTGEMILGYELTEKDIPDCDVIEIYNELIEDKDESK